MEFYTVGFKEQLDYFGMQAVANQEFGLVADCNSLRYLFFVRLLEIVLKLKAGNVRIYSAHQSLGIDQWSCLSRNHCPFWARTILRGSACSETVLVLNSKLHMKICTGIEQKTRY